MLRKIYFFCFCLLFFFFSSRRRHTRFKCDWSSDVCSSDYQCSRAVVRSRRVPGSDGAVFFERGLELRERFRAGVLARRLVILDYDRLAFFLWHFDWQNLGLEETGVARAHDFLVSLERNAV